MLQQNVGADNIQKVALIGIQCVRWLSPKKNTKKSYLKHNKKNLSDCQEKYKYLKTKHRYLPSNIFSFVFVRMILATNKIQRLIAKIKILFIYPGN